MAQSRFWYIVTAVALVLLTTFELSTRFGSTPTRWSLWSNICQWQSASHTVGQAAPVTATQEYGKTDGAYLLGVGKADITGPVVELNLMGYANTDQTGSGLRQRIYSRAFIVADKERSGDRFVYLVLDTQSGDTAVRYGILDGLAALGEGYEVYGQNNVAVTGTHSHSGPAAWLNYLLPQITSKGFSKQSYQAIVDGAMLSIKRAHESLQPGDLTVGSTNVKNANINRSLYAYLANPSEERAKYKHDVDKEMTLLKFTSSFDGKTMGILTWFPVHGTSMLNNNTLISGDNKGVAALIFEKAAATLPSAAPGFVAGFSQSNVGDTTPNILGAYCEDGSNTACTFNSSTCAGRNEPCHGRGPHFRTKDQGASSCYEIGRRQYHAARSLHDKMQIQKHIPLTGPVKAAHTFTSLANYNFTLPNGTAVSTCPAALGYSFAAGTSDGPGAFDFQQANPGDPVSNPVWGVVRNVLKKPSEAQQACHAPKPILLNVGEITTPYAWTPNIVDTQLLRVGQLFIIVSSGEATTMSGRRWKDAIAAGARELQIEGDPIVVLGGPANSYTHYIATEEEYAIQRYEGASTLYGPHTLNAHIHLSAFLLPYLAANSTTRPPPGPSPPNNVNASLSFITGVIADSAGFFRSFGDVLEDVKPVYHVGETVTAKFVGANPRNNLRLEGNYVVVEREKSGAKGGKGKWEVVRDDSDWDLVFRWERKSTVLGTSEVGVEWTVEEGTVGGRYRVRYSGDKKALLGSVEAFEGVSGVFDVV